MTESTLILGNHITKRSIDFTWYTGITAKHNWKDESMKQTQSYTCIAEYINFCCLKCY